MNESENKLVISTNSNPKDTMYVKQIIMYELIEEMEVSM